MAARTTEPMHESLPLIPAAIDYNKVPRRYEETKQWNLQSMTHTKIIHLGEKIHEREVSAIERHTNKALKEAEEEIWRKAEEEQQRAIKVTLDRVQSVHTKEIRRISAQVTQKLEKELIRHRNLATMESQEEVKRVRADLTRDKARAINELEHKCRQELIAVVEETKREELNKHQVSVKTLVKDYEGKISDIKEKLVKEKETELKKLETRLQKEKEQSLLEICTNERKHGEELLSKETALHRANVKSLNCVIQRKDKENNYLQGVIREERAYEGELVKALYHMRDCFQSFVNDVSLFDQAYTDYLVPAITVVKYRE